MIPTIRQTIRVRIGLAVFPLIALLVGGSGDPSGGRLAERLREIEQARGKIRTLQARFVQTKHLKLLEKPLVSRGRFAFQSPDRLLWLIEEPASLRIVVRGERVFLPGLSARDQEALGSSGLAALLRDMSTIFEGPLGQLQDSFDLSISTQADAIDVMLVPRLESWKRMFRNMQLRLARPHLLVERLRLEESVGDSVEIVFDQLERNIDLPESEFDTN